MQELSIIHPFGAPVYYCDMVGSTMDESRRLAEQGAPHGTVLLADFQSSGRGRGARLWQAERGKNLFFTVLLRYPDYAAIHPALTLRTGLAVALAIVDFAPALAPILRVKWPNDIMLGSKKAVGIITEAVGTNVYIGVGVNVAQSSFPPALAGKATSIVLALGNPELAIDRFSLLEVILGRLFEEISEPVGDWRERLSALLYMSGERVRFLAGAADVGAEVFGQIAGVGCNGELLILPDGASEPIPFITGELDVYGVT
ncbi:MAG: biotin--[acetyl-CoA-carboxylase] ligase [Treponema sp.]|jgi:BirA family biotin operon repressor/biotin-[acetyl-CoA-carboxylase] ligase|nr:biotin--[acetyl-CoA-carboxylase] ligase [Treponema sp.]